MRDFSILIPSLSPKKFDLINCFKDNADGVNVKVYVTNCDERDLPQDGLCDGVLLAPRNDSPEYINWMLNTCRQYGIDIILPRLTSELELFSIHRKCFEDEGIKVAVTGIDGLSIANDKNKLHRLYSSYMPAQMVCKSSEDVMSFSKKFPVFCCKLPHSAGAAGFAIVDDKLCDRVTLFHAYGRKHYISTNHLCRIVNTQNLDYIVQEFVPGYDYTVSLICQDGVISHIVGYIGYEMEFSCIMYGEILPNEEAFDISKRIVSDLNLSGNIGIDFIVKPNGSVVLLEVNPRMNATLPFVAAAGCNMPYLRCKQLLGYDISEEGQNIQVGLKMRKHYVSDYFV